MFLLDRLAIAVLGQWNIFKTSFMIVRERFRLINFIFFFWICFDSVPTGQVQTPQRRWQMSNVPGSQYGTLLGIFGMQMQPELLSRSQGSQIYAVHS